MNTYFEWLSPVSNAANLFQCVRIISPQCFSHVYSAAISDVRAENSNDAQKLWRRKVRPYSVSPMAVPRGQGVNSQHMILASSSSANSLHTLLATL